MPTIYNNNKIIPSPFMEIEEVFTKNDQGEIIGSVFDITLTGKLSAWQGSPTSSGSFWTQSNYPPDENIAQTSRLSSIITKQKALENLFGQQGKTFSVVGFDGQNVLTCNPMCNGITFAPGIWTEYCDYTIKLMANSINGVTSGSGYNLKSASESWQVELNDHPESDINPQSFRVTHNLSAQGLLIYNSDGTFIQPYIWAQNWVLGKLGFNSTFTTGSGVVNVPSYLSNWNQVRSKNVDTQAGTVQASESWIMASGNTLEDFTISSKTSIEEGITHVSIHGDIQGLETRDSNNILQTTKWQAASGAWQRVQSNIFGRAQNYSNVSLNPQVVITDVGFNPAAGVINYAYEYNTRPSNYVSGVRSEIVTIIDGLQNDVFAIIPVLGRAAGPVLQGMSTYSENTRQLSIELIVQAQSLGVNANAVKLSLNANPRVTSPYAQGIADIITAAIPVGATQVFSSQHQDTWNPKTGAYTYSKVITWQ